MKMILDVGYMSKSWLLGMRHTHSAYRVGWVFGGVGKANCINYALSGGLGNKRSLYSNLNFKKDGIQIMSKAGLLIWECANH